MRIIKSDHQTLMCQQTTSINNIYRHTFKHITVSILKIKSWKVLKIRKIFKNNGSALLLKLIKHVINEL